MFLPVSRRLLEAEGSFVFINSSSISSNISSTSADVGLFVNSSYNASGEGMVDFGELEFGYSDMQTVFLACIATLLPLVFILLVAIGVRFLWRRFRTRKTDGYDDVLQRDGSSDPLAVKSLSPSGNLLTDELKTSESQFTVTPAEEIEDVTSQSPLLSYGASSGSLPNDTSKSANGTSKSANGSIITMTLKNNHLIVETEERGVTLQDGSTKTTTTKFTTSASPNEENVFVVEVQQSGSARNNNVELYPKLLSAKVSSQEYFDEEGINRRSSSQRAQVHRPPDIDVEEVSDEEDLEEVEDDEDDEEEDTIERQVKSDARGEDNCNDTLNTNTGLSQSDLSISSSGSNNPSYSYGNQVGYEGGQYGYPQYVGYVSGDEKLERTVGGVKPGAQRWKSSATAAMNRVSTVTEGTEKETSNLHVRGRYSIDVMPVKSRLLSDIQAMERQKLEDELLQEEQRQLGNGVQPFAVSNGDTLMSEKMAEDKEESEPALMLTESLSCQVEETQSNAEQNSGNTGEIKSEQETEVGKMAVEESDEKLDGNWSTVAKKRASLPIITPELYTQIKETTKSLIIDKTSRPGLSPKFEKFRNENSPLEETKQDMGNDAPQTANTNPVNSQEYENAAFVPSDQVAS